MKKSLLAAAVAAVVIPAVIVAAPGHGGKHGERMLNHMSEKLELTDEQKAEVGTLFKEQHEKRKALREETHSGLKEILTDEQEAKLEQMRAERKQRWHKKREQCKEPDAKNSS